MKQFFRITALFYVTLVLFLGVVMVLFILNPFGFEKNVYEFLQAIRIDQRLKTLVGVLSFLLLYINFLFYKYFTVNVHQEKTIAFDNPSGRVSVSLVALEDLIKRQVLRLSEVKEVKPIVKATKKGLQVKIRLMLRSEGNIPEMTMMVQDIVKSKIQSTIGLDEPIDIAIFVGKIYTDQLKEKKESSREEEEENRDANIPFQGYRA